VPPFDEQQHGGTAGGAEAALVQGEVRELLGQALEELPEEFREVIVLRELEGLSYKEIAGITGAPLGTVMSRLARGRERLQQCLGRRGNKEP
jgi:RNA polymerase sigma-70 factor (ECF subfamily)